MSLDAARSLIRPSTASTPPRDPAAPPTSDFPLTLSALSHLCVGAMIPTLAMLNFPQAMLLATVLIPLLFLSSPPPTSSLVKASGASRALATIVKRWALCALSPVGVLALLQRCLGEVGAAELVEGLVVGWEVLGNWCWPGIWGVWWAVWAQTAFVSCIN